MQANAAPDPAQLRTHGKLAAPIERRALMIRWPYICAMSTLLLFRSRCHTSCWCRYVTACSICAAMAPSGTKHAVHAVREPGCLYECSMGGIAPDTVESGCDTIERCVTRLPGGNVACLYDLG